MESIKKDSHSHSNINHIFMQLHMPYSPWMEGCNLTWTSWQIIWIPMAYLHKQNHHCSLPRLINWCKTKSAVILHRLERGIGYNGVQVFWPKEESFFFFLIITQGILICLSFEFSYIGLPFGFFMGFLSPLNPFQCFAMCYSKWKLISK